jgi:hypothetical protein
MDATFGDVIGKAKEAGTENDAKTTRLGGLKSLIQALDRQLWEECELQAKELMQQRQDEENLLELRSQHEVCMIENAAIEAVIVEVDTQFPALDAHAVESRAENRKLLQECFDLNLERTRMYRNDAIAKEFSNQIFARLNDELLGLEADLAVIKATR